MKRQKVELTQEEAKRYYEAIEAIVEGVAERVGVDPRGYGCYNPRIVVEWVTEKPAIYAEWTRSDSCD